jgi:hypothetical protein
VFKDNNSSFTLTLWQRYWSEYISSFQWALKKLLLGHLIRSLHLLAEMHYPKQYTPNCLIGNVTLAQNSYYIRKWSFNFWCCHIQNEACSFLFESVVLLDILEFSYAYSYFHLSKNFRDDLWDIITMMYETYLKLSIS